MNGIVLSYDPYFYYIPSTTTCTLNAINTPCTPLTSSSLLVTAPTSTLTASDISLSVNGVINYVRQGNWSITSVMKNNGSYSDVDVYTSATSGLTSSMQNSAAKVRVIFPNNHVSPQKVTVIVLIDNLFDQNMVK